MKSYEPEGQSTSGTTWQLLEANPAWAEAIETEIVAYGVTVKYLRCAGLDCAATNTAQWEGVTLRMES